MRRRRCTRSRQGCRSIHPGDAFRRGFESCHENIILPLRQTTISHEAALDEMRRHGDPVCETIVAKFEESPGVPSQLDIHEVELPETRNSDGPIKWSRRDLKLTQRAGRLPHSRPQ